MSGSLSKLEKAMQNPYSLQQNDRKSSRRSVLDSNASALASANKMREYSQTAGGSQAADLHARFFAENALQYSQYDVEVDVENKASVSIRQLLSVDPRMNA